ncbi:MAG: zinc ribbon domain-containing protein [Planctomycetota bacterium]
MPDKEPRSPARRGRIKDARGQRTTQLDPISMHYLRQRDVIDAETLRTLAAEIGIGWPRFVKVLFFVVIADLTICLVVSGVDFFKEVIVGGSGFGAFILERLLPLTPLWACPMFIWFVSARVRFSRVRSAMLRRSLCPHCGYKLKGLPVDETDGATVCPECGCAWQLPDSANRGTKHLQPSR